MRSTVGKMLLVLLVLALVMPAEAEPAAAKAPADRYAVVIGARGGNQALSDEVLSHVTATRAVLQAAGFDDSRIHLFSDGGSADTPRHRPITREAVLEGLAALSKTLGPEDELWLFLYGYANVNSRGVSILTDGRRLRSGELAQALGAIPGRHVVLVLNRQAAALVPELGRDGRIVISATNNEPQLNPPVLPRYLLELWRKDVDQPLLDLLREAGDATIHHYRSRSLALAEMAYVFDGNEGASLPFEALSDGPLAQLRLGSEAAEPALAHAEAAADRLVSKSLTSPQTKLILPPLLDAADLLPQDPDQLEANRLPALEPATDQTRQFMSNVTQLADRYDGYAAFYVQDHRDVLINPDHATRTTYRTSVYLRQDVAVERFGQVVLADRPPDVDLTIEQARILYPDGSYRVLTPEQRGGFGSRQHRVVFPEARAGCVLQLAWHVIEPPSRDFLAFYEDMLLAREAPAASSTLRLRYPLERGFQHKLYHHDATPKASKTAYSHVIEYDLGEMPAIEPLAYDPPLRAWVPRVQVSSLASWDEFEGWARRLTQGADVLDEETRQLAQDLTSDAQTDTQKVRALYEFLCDLRYDTTPIGARRFRPRSAREVWTSRSGDCKDKANALVVMAKAVGVEGYFALVNRGSVTDTEFPAWQFNHALAYFPELEGHPDGLWLDATDGSTPFGTLPPGDLGRAAFVFEPDGATFQEVTLPEGETTILKQDLQLTYEDHHLTGRMTVEATGLVDYQWRQRLKGLGPEQTRAALQALADLTSRHMIVRGHKVSNLASLSTPLRIELDVQVLTVPDGEPRIGLPYDLWSPVAAPTRNRPLQLNDGQPLRIEQDLVIQFAGSPANLDRKEVNEPFQSSGPGTAEIRQNIAASGGDEGGWLYQRQTVFEQPGSLIATEDYAQFRRSILEFLGQLAATPWRQGQMPPSDLRHDIESELQEAQ